MNYRGRIAPSPTGFLHDGHAATFQIAADRARQADGTLIFRMEDIDLPRCRPEFSRACVEDLRRMGLVWTEGPDTGGPHAPYTQSERLHLYRAALETLRVRGVLYPCRCSRKDIQRALAAPHEGEDEPLYPGTCRPDVLGTAPEPSENVTWRFRVPFGREITFVDGAMGEQTFVAGKDFGDFPVWRKDNLPAYQLAVVVDDAAMGITEVVRGEDLLLSTARQILLYEALGLAIPAFYHCPLVRDASGNRLSKRNAGSLTVHD